MEQLQEDSPLGHTPGKQNVLSHEHLAVEGGGGGGGVGELCHNSTELKVTEK